MKCPFNDQDCTGIDTSGMSQFVPCYECGRYNDGIRATGAMPDIGLKRFFSYLWNRMFAIKTNRWYLRNCNYEYRWFYMPESKDPLFKLVPKTYQFINWHKFKGFTYLKGDPNKQPAAFHLIYKWSLFLGWFEIRKFLDDKQMEQALNIYNKDIRQEASEAIEPEMIDQVCSVCGKPFRGTVRILVCPSCYI